ncbi:MAG: phosphonate metabolism protein/1,5-bisphosphokinase (PRPP-forming) PhnN [Proteobacteria bacterium]|nr:phosphonate metabolism protein/1,5-bisphosphokinase (PRPP-forming) PhnN [Pseudomonadota bacterium]
MSAPLVYVMGPSGAGKDSILARARERLPVDAPVVFAHRYITRRADAGGENHVALSPAEFALRRARGLFAFHWQAHGNAYGIGVEIEEWRAQGLTVVVSGSREHYERLADLDPGVVPVLVTADRETLRARLAARGREDGAATARRLARSEALIVNDPRLVTIVNDGSLDDAAAAFLRVLTRLPYAPDAPRPVQSAPAL